MTPIAAIRKAEGKDRPALEVCFAELQSFERTIEPNRVEPERVCGPYIDLLLDDCEKKSGTFLVAESAGRVVGFVCVLARVPADDILEVEPEYAYVTDLVVLQEFRGSGLGAALMQAAEEYARQCGATRIRLSVLAANAGAHRLYQSLGYRDSEIILEKPIVPAG